MHVLRSHISVDASLRMSSLTDVTAGWCSALMTASISVCVVRVHCAIAFVVVCCIPTLGLSLIINFDFKLLNSLCL